MGACGWFGAGDLLLPPRFKPRDGVVAAVLDGLDDPGLALACRVAAALGADMVLFLTEPASAVHARRRPRPAHPRPPPPP